MGSAVGHAAHSEVLLDGLPNPVFVKDEQHRWVLLNEAFCRFIGHSRAELIGKSDYDFFPKEEAEVFWRKDDLVFASGAAEQVTRPAVLLVGRLVPA